MMTSSLCLDSALPGVPPPHFSPAEREALILAHRPVVSSIARRIYPLFRQPGPDLADLEQVGTIGLIKAIDAFDPSRGCAVGTFAVYKIRGYILDFLAKQFPGTQQQFANYHRLHRASVELTRTLQRTPTDQDLATHLGLSLPEFTSFRDRATPPAFYRASERMPSRFDESLNTTYTRNDIPSPDPDPPTLALNADLRERLAKALNQLPAYQRQILTLHTAGDYTLRQICKQMHTDSRTAKKALDRAMIALRSHLGVAQPACHCPGSLNHPLPTPVSPRPPAPAQLPLSPAFA